MPAILLALFLFQGGANNAGAVTGVVRSGGVPAPSVRVYAQQVRDAADASSPAAPLEGQAQTDAAGRYRLELAPGRYYIASGAVSSPTYYPGTTELAAAMLVTVTPGGVTEGIDFSSFTSVLPGISNAQPAGGLIFGMVRYPDGSRAVNITVMAFPSSAVVPAGTVAPWYATLRVQTDSLGGYSFRGVQSDTYYVVAGFAEAWAFYTGGPNSTTPKTVVMVAPATVVLTDVEIPRPISRTGTTVRGQVLTARGDSAPGTTVTIASPSPSPMGVMGVRLPSAYAVPDVQVAPDGTFEFSNVVPGFYNARASLRTVHVYQSFEVGENPVTDVKLSLP